MWSPATIIGITKVPNKYTMSQVVVDAGFAQSNADAKKFIKQGAIRICKDFQCVTKKFIDLMDEDNGKIKMIAWLAEYPFKKHSETVIEGQVTEFEDMDDDFYLVMGNRLRAVVWNRF